MTLFAASDDLLAVARLVADGQHRKNCWLIIDGDGPCDCIVGLARSALAKAEGRTPEGK